MIAFKYVSFLVFLWEAGRSNYSRPIELQSNSIGINKKMINNTGCPHKKYTEIKINVMAKLLYICNVIDTDEWTN